MAGCMTACVDRTSIVYQVRRVFCCPYASRCAPVVTILPSTDWRHPEHPVYFLVTNTVWCKENVFGNVESVCLLSPLMATNPKRC